MGLGVDAQPRARTVQQEDVSITEIVDKVRLQIHAQSSHTAEIWSPHMFRIYTGSPWTNFRAKMLKSREFAISSGGSNCEQSFVD